MGVGVAGTFVEVFGIGHFDDFAEVHDGDAVADVFDYGEVVGDEEVAETHFLLEVEHEVEDLRLHGNIKGGYGLVADDELRLEGNGAGNADALALAAGELEGIFLGRGGGEADAFESLIHPFATFPSGADVVNDVGFLEDAADAVAGVEGFGGVLEDHLHFTAQGAEFGLAEVGDVAFSKEDAACGGLVEADDGFAEGGLATARFADKAKGFAGGDVERYTIDGAHPAALEFEQAAGDGEMDF